MKVDRIVVNCRVSQKKGFFLQKEIISLRLFGDDPFATLLELTISQSRSVSMKTNNKESKVQRRKKINEINEKEETE